MCSVGNSLPFWKIAHQKMRGGTGHTAIEEAAKRCTGVRWPVGPTHQKMLDLSCLPMFYSRSIEIGSRIDNQVIGSG